VNKALVDTDIRSEIMRGRNERVLKNAPRYVSEHSRFTLSAMPVAEIVKGLRKASRREAVDRFVAELAPIQGPRGGY
jgi:tRNA(fMet)-specific endonuclease VapC